MKTWKHVTFAAVIAVFSIVVALTACDNGNGSDENTGNGNNSNGNGNNGNSDPVPCECPADQKIHDSNSPCDCEWLDNSCDCTTAVQPAFADIFTLTGTAAPRKEKVPVTQKP